MIKKFTPDNIHYLSEKEVFVFGSNLKGHHQGGAARIARERFGAIIGQGIGLQGQSYAIPTMHGGVDKIKPYVDDFIQFAQKHPDLTFYVTRIGCGIAGFKDEDIAPLFDAAFNLPNIILPKKFWHIINHTHRLASETDGLVFHCVPLKFFDEDIAKMNGMTTAEKIDFIRSLKKNEQYTVAHDSPETEYGEFVLNTNRLCHHKIAISETTYAIIAGSKLYSNQYSWGIDFGQEILSIVAKDNSARDHPYGQFIVLLVDGSIAELWSESSIKQLSQEKIFCGIASGCNGLVFGLRKDGTVAVFYRENNIEVANEIAKWSDVIQVESGPRHVVGLRQDKTVIAAGKASACEPLRGWEKIERIYVVKECPLYGKKNDLTFGIDWIGWLHVAGDTWSKRPEFWKRINAQYNVTDVVEDGYCIWVRTRDEITRAITYYSEMNYMEELNFVKKYSGFRFYDSYGNFKVLVDNEGEFRVLYHDREVKWWNLQPIK